mgnify:CR=1 FL=1|jgi:hypothetical protein
MINPDFIDTTSLYRYKTISSFISKNLNEKYFKLNKSHFNHVKFKSIQHENFPIPSCNIEHPHASRVPSICKENDLNFMR